VQPKDRWFEVRDFATALAPAVLRFVSNVDPEKFNAGCVADMGALTTAYVEFVQGGSLADGAG
jgi:hypothetical protein